MSFNIITKAQPHQSKTMVYALSGVGKSTLASQMEKPLFIDIEGGVNNMDVPRTPTIGFYTSFIKVVNDLHAEAAKYLKDYQTLVVDSMDWLVRKAEEHASGVRTVNGTEVVTDMTATIGKANGGYGNGNKQLENHIRAEVLPALQLLVDDGFAICLIAHADQKDLMDAEGYRVAKVSPAIGERVMEPIVQWCDNVFYLRNDGGERKLLLEGTPTILAKNRLGLTGEVSLSDTTIKKILVPKKVEGVNGQASNPAN